MSCSRTQHGGGRFRTPDLSLRSPPLFHWATALPSWDYEKLRNWCDFSKDSHNNDSIIKSRVVWILQKYVFRLKLKLVFQVIRLRPHPPTPLDPDFFKRTLRGFIWSDTLFPYHPHIKIFNKIKKILPSVPILKFYVTWNTQATSWQNQQNGVCAQRRLHPVWSVFAVCMKKAWVLSYPLSAQWRLIKLGRCPGWSESSLGMHAILLVLSWSGSFLFGLTCFPEGSQSISVLSPPL